MFLLRPVPWLTAFALKALLATLAVSTACAQPPIRRLARVDNSISTEPVEPGTVAPASAQVPNSVADTSPQSPEHLPQAPAELSSELPLSAGLDAHLGAMVDSAQGDPETLDVAWAVALQFADRLAAARLSVAEAEALRNSAVAERWPNLDLSASYRVRNDNPAFSALDLSAFGQASRDFPTAQREALGFRGAVTLPLYTSGRIPSQIGAADAWVQAARSNADLERSELKMSVADEYVAVLRGQSEVDVARSNVRSLDAHAQEVHKRYDQGLSARNDLLAAQVSLANARHVVIHAENRLDVARSALNRRLGRPLSAPVTLAELSLSAPNEDLETLTGRSLGSRHELSRLACEAAARRQEAESILAADRLQLGVVGDYGYEENRYVSPQGLASVGVGGAWNAFDGGQSRYRAAALHRRADALLRMRSDLESAIRVEVRTAWLNVQEALRHIEVAREAIDRAEENLRVARRRYDQGTGTARDVLDAESLRTESERNHSSARYDCVLAVLRLQKATGDL